jgi:hypothetical protein
MNDVSIEVSHNETGTIRSVQFVSEDPGFEHYGKKGMKWGVRNRTKAEDRERGKRFKASQNRRRIPDAELDSMISRLEKEKKLKNLVAEDLSPGTQVVKKIVGDSGQKIARTVVAGAGIYAVKTVIDKKFGKEAAAYIAPKLKK